jgi:hypothetical protein
MKKQIALYVYFGLSILSVIFLAGCRKDRLTSQQRAELMSQQSRETHDLLMTMMSNQHQQNNSQENVTLEGKLKIHPKFLYKYYIEAYGGQTCALYGDENPQEYARLEGVKPDTYISVRGHLGTRLFEGGTEDNPSPFGRTWVIYMEVKEITRLDQTGI